MRPGRDTAPPLPPGSRPDTESGPLDGLRVVVTRARHQAASTLEAFRAAGARVELLPLLEVIRPPNPSPLEQALDHVESYDWIVFTSTNAVEQLAARLAEHGRALPAGSTGATVAAGPGLAAIGAATAEALRALGREPAVEATDSRAEGLAAALGPHLTAGARVLLPQAADARTVLETELRRLGARPERVATYAKRTPPGSRRRAAEIFGTATLGWVTFTSPSIARAFAGLWDEGWEARRRGLLAVSIGPVTSQALRGVGVEPAAEAASPGDAEMVEAVVSAVSPRPTDRG